MTLSNRPLQFPRCSKTSYLVQSSNLPNLPEDLLEKISNLSSSSKVNLHLTCKQIDAALKKIYRRASFGQINQRYGEIIPLLSSVQYKNLKEFSVVALRFNQKEKIISLVRSFPALRSFKLNGSNCIDDSLMNSLQSLANLQSISFYKCVNVSPFALGHLIASQKKLQNLYLDSGNFEGLQDISFSNLSNLESLELSDCQDLSDQTMGNLLAATSSLKILKLTGVPTFSGSAFARLNSNKLIEIEIRYPLLDPTDQKYEFDSISMLLNKNTGLEVLDFSGHISTSMFKPGQGKRHRAQLDNVKRLSLGYVDLDEMKDLMCLGKSVEYLEIFQPSDYRKQNYASLLGDLTNLKTLGLECCRKMTNHDFNILTRKTNKLTKINVDHCSVEIGNTLTGKALTSVDLSKVHEFSWISDCDELECTFDSSDLGDAIRRMPLLEKFHFEEGKASEDQNFGDLKGVFKNLKSLTINGLEQLTNCVLENLIFDASNLEIIELAAIEKLSGRILFTMIDRCHKLNKIDIYCPNISEKQLEDMKDYICSRNIKNKL